MFQIFLFQIFEFNKFYFHKIIITYPRFIIDPHLTSKFSKNVTKRYQDYSNLVHSVSSILFQDSSKRYTPKKFLKQFLSNNTIIFLKITFNYFMKPVHNFIRKF